MKFDPGDVAAQLLLMENTLYARISANELIIWSRDRDSRGGEKSRDRNRDYGEDRDEDTIKNLDRFCKFNKRLGKLVKFLILSTDPVTKRRELLLHLIRVIEVCCYESLCLAFPAFASCHLLFVSVIALVTWHLIFAISFFS